MSKRTYPRQAWVLQPSFRPKEVTLVRKAYPYYSADYGDESDSGKVYGVSEMHPTKESAIEDGWRRIREEEAKLAKKQDGLNKKRAQLARAAST